MTVVRTRTTLKVGDAAVTRMRDLLEELFPLPRSITGEGLRATLAVLARELGGLKVHEVPSGTNVFDWTVPPEWNVKRARLIAPDGEVVADFHRHNLMLLNYSEPFRGRMRLEDLQPHLHSLPDRPSAIPYKTSYYNRTWGFCLPHEARERLVPGEYEIEIDTQLSPGSLTYAELLVPGTSAEEVLLSAHVCHPSMANDNLSGVVVLTELARWLIAGRHRLTYRVLFAPGTIGTIAFLSRTPAARQNIAHGLVLAGLGDAGPLTYKQTFAGDKFVDRAARHVLSDFAGSAVLPFDPSGYDERQYASPGLRLAVGRLGRTEPGTYPEYHTSLDNPSFVSDTSLLDSLTALKRIVSILEEGARRYVSLAPFGEPQLGRRGLLSPSETQESRSALLWLLALADGKHTLLDAAERSGLRFEHLQEAHGRLARAGLFETQDEGENSEPDGPYI